jgi:transcription elongation factor GreA
MNDAHLISAAAYAELEAEIEKLETVDRLAIAEKISVAREDGDLKENAEYHAAKNDQSFLETRILQLRDQLQNAQIVEATAGASEVGFGSTVSLRDKSSGKEVTYTIVSSYEQDISTGKLSNSSPVAEAIIGKSVGEVAKVKLPSGGQREFEVLSIG